MKVFKITCRQAQVLLSERQDRLLRPGEVLRLRVHLIACDWCARISRQFRLMSEAVRKIGRPPERS